MKYTVIVSDDAERQLDRMPNNYSEKIIGKVQSLSENPRPFGYKKLKNRAGYAIRWGDYRIIYEIEDDVLKVLVITIGNRKEIYRGL